MTQGITAEYLLAAYAAGYFPMAENRDDQQLYWFHPGQRGILPLDHFHIPRKLAKLMRKQPFGITINQSFPEVMLGCAERPQTWINQPILTLYNELHDMGYAHSLECWQDGKLAGGIYGVALGGAFFGESMFSRVSNASKIALVTLIGKLKIAGYQLFDTQYLNDHLKQFGVAEIPRAEYLQRLQEALSVTPLALSQVSAQAWPTTVE